MGNVIEHTCECGSTRMLKVYGHCKDMGAYTYGSEGEVAYRVEDSYAPHIKGVCGGDDIELLICCDCHKVQDVELDESSVRQAFKDALGDEGEIEDDY